MGMEKETKGTETVSIFDLFKQIEQEKPNTAPITWLIAGLGNPGQQYTWTRHNAGFLYMDCLCEKYACKTDRARFSALCGETVMQGIRVLLMKPQTFMNLSGKAIREAADFYKIPPQRILVVEDDATLAIGALRIREKGSAGGHNGLKSILECLGSDAFPRIKIGVGQNEYPDIADWVLGEIPKVQREVFLQTARLAVEATALIVQGECETAKMRFNRSKA